jgi:hypothetical protein
MTDRYQDRPFPADAAYDRAGQPVPAKSETDPLAELARLIGQTDPFANFGRANPAAQPRPAEQYRLPTTAPAIDDELPVAPLPAWMKHRQPLAPDPLSAADQDYREPDGSADSKAQYAGDSHRYDDALYGQPEPAAPGVADGQYQDSFPSDPYAYQDDYSETEPQPLKPRRGGMVTVVAVLALAVVGTGGAFAYRTYMGSARSGEPPVIKADAGPTKVVPAPAADGSGKQIQDRLAGSGGGENLVSREEQPVDPAKSGPRVVLPQTNQPPNPAVANVAPGPKPIVSQPNNGTLSGDEPRKIRTLSVRPDQADPAAAPVRTPATAARTAPAAAVRNPPPPVANANASTANAPLSLSPQAADAAPPRAARVASAPAAAQPAVSGGGGYVVQVSSQRSEADAQSSYRALQGKFPSVLASRPPLIKRADLGDKGVYYRAMVGPFGSPDEASQFCGSLKSAGGQCVVQRN